MEEECRRSSGAERGGDLASDDAALAHAGDDDASGAGGEQRDGAFEILGHRSADAVGERAQRFSLDADYVLAGVLHGCVNGNKTVMKSAEDAEDAEGDEENRGLTPTTETQRTQSGAGKPTCRRLFGRPLAPA